MLTSEDVVVIRQSCDHAHPCRNIEPIYEKLLYQLLLLYIYKKAQPKYVPSWLSEI